MSLLIPVDKHSLQLYQRKFFLQPRPLCKTVADQNSEYNYHKMPRPNGYIHSTIPASKALKTSWKRKRRRSSEESSKCRVAFSTNRVGETEQIQCSVYFTLILHHVKKNEGNMA